MPNADERRLAMKPANRRTRLITFLLLAAILISSAVYWLANPTRRDRVLALCRAAVGETSPDAEPAGPQPFTVSGDTIEFDHDTFAASGMRLLTVSATDEPVLLKITGRTGQNAETVTHVHAQFPGRVAEVGVQLGSLVRGPGDPSGPPTVLCIVESTDLASAKSDYLKAKVQLETDEDSLRRAQSLGENGVVSEKAQLDARATVRKSAADKEAARQRLLLFGLTETEIGQIEMQQGRERMLYKVLSPRSGMVTEKSVSPGELADPTANLFTIADTSTLWVWGDVYEHELPKVRVGQPLLITVAGHEGPPIQSKVDWISPVIDPATRSVRIRGTIQNVAGSGAERTSLLADMYADIAIVLDPGKDSVVLPATAVVSEGTRAFVFVAHQQPAENGKGGFVAQRRAVVAQPLDKDRVRVIQGLSPGEEVVVRGGLGLLTQTQQE
jgi:cobalt-zinc-cadmium efflux system membrane fusion protein